MRRLLGISAAILLAALAIAQPRVGGFGFGGNPRVVTSAGPSYQYDHIELMSVYGQGNTDLCACVNPTTALGIGTLTVTRANTMSCTKGGLSDSNIAPGDMVWCAPNLARVERDGSGDAGMRCEQTSVTNLALRTEEFDNAAWVSTATVVAGTDGGNPSPDGGAGQADLLEDTSGALSHSSCQTIATTSQTKHVASTYVKAGSLTSAKITLTGTGNSAGDCSATVTGLSTSTWNRLWCSSSAAYGAGITAVVVCVLPGTVASDTGSIIAWGANHYVSATGPSSYIYSTSASVARGTDTATILVPDAGVWTTRGLVRVTATPIGTTEGAPGATFGTNARALYSNATTMLAYDGTNNPSLGGAPFVHGVAKVFSGEWGDGGLIVRNVTAATQTKGNWNGTSWAPGTTITVCGSPGTCNAIVSNFCASYEYPDAGGCDVW